MPMTPEERTLRARAAAHALHAQGKTNTGPARQAYTDRFLNQVDPDGILELEEREKRAAHARKAHFANVQRLGLKAIREAREALDDDD